MGAGCEWARLVSLTLNKKGQQQHKTTGEQSCMYSGEPQLQGKNYGCRHVLMLKLSPFFGLCSVCERCDLTESERLCSVLLIHVVFVP